MKGISSVLIKYGVWIVAVSTGVFLLMSGNVHALENPIGVDNVEDLLDKVLNYAMYLAGIIAVILIMIGGIIYMTESDKAEGNRKGIKFIKFALIGLGVVLIARGLVAAVKVVL